MRFFLSFIFMLTCIGVSANDTLRVLSEDAFISIVRSYHPVAKQGQLLVDRARAELTASRAGFDPQFYLYSDRKTFDGKTYYDITNPELKIPTWYGIEVKAGLENNLGDFLNPDLSEGKSSYLGVTVPLAKNLLMDKRRAVLKQAKIFRDQSKAERLIMINDLLNDAYETYWYWVRDYEVYNILTNAVYVNETRLRLIKIGFAQGDRPALDTTEALAQLQSFQLARNEAYLNFRNSGLMLSNFMWTPGNSAYYLSETVVPDSSWRTLNIIGTELPVLDSLISIARNEHPKLASFNFKLQMLDIERSLKFQNLLPLLNVRYNILNTGYNVLEDASAALYRNNYKFGVDFGLPLRLSQGRGEYRAARIKIEETNLDVVQARLAIDNKVKYYFNELATLQLQVRIAEDNLQNYQRLFRGEDLRFRVGESSLFILNSRENKVLESMQKLAELKTKFFKSYRSVTWASGQLR